MLRWAIGFSLAVAATLGSSLPPDGPMAFGTGVIWPHSEPSPKLLGFLSVF